jgi:soluble lytic murein transglycosylase
MAYLAAKIKQFGQVHLALASYNAGERPVHRWMNERPDLPQDEFIDDIPYPQTNNYVKKLLSPAEDYRRLYGPESHLEVVLADASPAVAPAPAVTPARTSPGLGAKSKTAPAAAAKKPARKPRERARRRRWQNSSVPKRPGSSPNR